MTTTLTAKPAPCKLKSNKPCAPQLFLNFPPNVKKYILHHPQSVKRATLLETPLEPCAGTASDHFKRLFPASPGPASLLPLLRLHLWVLRPLPGRPQLTTRFGASPLTRLWRPWRSAGRGVQRTKLVPRTRFTTRDLRLAGEVRRPHAGSAVSGNRQRRKNGSSGEHSRLCCNSLVGNCEANISNHLRALPARSLPASQAAAARPAPAHLAELGRTAWATTQASSEMPRDSTSHLAQGWVTRPHELTQEEDLAQVLATVAPFCGLHGGTRGKPPFVLRGGGVPQKYTHLGTSQCPGAALDWWLSHFRRAQACREARQPEPELSKQSKLARQARLNNDQGTFRHVLILLSRAAAIPRIIGKVDKQGHSLLGLSKAMTGVD